jgi:hypothetical protein
MSFGYVNPEYCTIKNTVGAGIQLTMNLPLDTKPIVLSEPALLVIVIYGVGIGGGSLGEAGRAGGVGIEQERREQERVVRVSVFQFGWSTKIGCQTFLQIVFRLAQTILTIGRKTQ